MKIFTRFTMYEQPACEYEYQFILRKALEENNNGFVPCQIDEFGTQDIDDEDDDNCGEDDILFCKKIKTRTNGGVNPQLNIITDKNGRLVSDIKWMQKMLIFKNSLEMAFEDGYVCSPLFTFVRLITNDPLFFSSRIANKKR